MSTSYRKTYMALYYLWTSPKYVCSRTLLEWGTIGAEILRISPLID